MEYAARLERKVTPSSVCFFTHSVHPVCAFRTRRFEENMREWQKIQAQNRYELLSCDWTRSDLRWTRDVTRCVSVQRLSNGCYDAQLLTCSATQQRACDASVR